MDTAPPPKRQKCKKEAVHIQPKISTAKNSLKRFESSLITSSALLNGIREVQNVPKPVHMKRVT